MENIVKSNINVFKTALDQFIEEKIECDIMIPDYSSPVGKIIKCDITPVIINKSIDSERLTIDGICNIGIIYCDEDSGAIKSVSESVPFTQSLKLERELENNRIVVKLRISNVMCRFVNSRRIGVKAILGIAVKVSGNDTAEIITDIEDDNIEILSDTLKRYAYAGCGEEDVHINGEIQTSHTPVDIINSYAVTLIKDIKPIKDKIIVKGETIINCIYTYGETISDIESSKGTVPFTEIIEVEGTDEDSQVNAECITKNIRCTVEDNIISAEVDIEICVAVYNNSEIKLIGDLYSKKNDININSQNINIETFNESLEIKCKVEGKFDFEMQDARIVDALSVPTIKNISYFNGKIMIDGELTVTVYAYNDNEYKIVDKVIPYTAQKDMVINSDSLRCEATVVSKGLNYSINMDDEFEISDELEFAITTFEKNDYIIIDGFDINYEADAQNTESKLVIYFAEKGENLWDIAKKFKTSVGALKRDNKMDEMNIKTDRVLLVSKN